MEMIKKIFACCIALLLMCTSMSCSSTKKNIETNKEKTEITEKEEGTKVIENVSKKDSIAEDECFENIGDTPIEVIKPDGSKIVLPPKASYKRSNNKTHINTFERRKDSLNVKKTTYTKKKTTKMDKEVDRKGFPDWVLLVIVIILIAIVYREWKEREK